MTPAFEFTGKKRGAVLVTNDPTYREDIDTGNKRDFEIHAKKKHYEPWVDFARTEGDEDELDVKPILMTGFDLTKEFAMPAYSDGR